jgi:DNA polymerase I-like protein with 3'-5' exonuclease and polymerase domains
MTVQLNFDRLDRSVLAFHECPPERDAISEGAAVFFEVAYADLTGEQRGIWKLITFGIRNQP